MIQTQTDPGPREESRFYAYCTCGICGPIRRRIEDAQADEDAHASVCREFPMEPEDE